MANNQFFMYGLMNIYIINEDEKHNSFIIQCIFNLQTNFNFIWKLEKKTIQQSFYAY